MTIKTAPKEVTPPLIETRPRHVAEYAFPGPVGLGQSHLGHPVDYVRSDGRSGGGDRRVQGV